MTSRLVFLKLGGSLITDKDRPHTPRLEVLQRLAGEIASALAQDQDLRILLGHGSGSFGHVPASKYLTRLGVRSASQWSGFIEVWREAAELNHIVLQALEQASLPAMAFPPSSMVLARQGAVEKWELEPLLQALEHNLLPVVNGDVVFDAVLGGTILSTEDLFAHLAGILRPASLLLAGNEPGVWADFPTRASLLPEITPQSFTQVEPKVSGSESTDVTGGMVVKVRQMISLVQANPGLRISIFSGEVTGNIRRALLGESLGTLIHA